ncbi:ribosome maturation factor RimP [Plantactinospora sp. KBS50]|uniref:ribosome maturation factor RimP n=1 Tax=Plantactinospora sp. KBS50 TaxID=2024580 RepID=UPI000BAAAC59|nr:ribosome maturation factor RimP [Plantactinospora sp. KBS50]ASW54064.1 ribosome maturation factor RimP [Plantactinospora sp. KBS50]
MTQRGRASGRSSGGPRPARTRSGDRPRTGDGPRGDRPRADLPARRQRLREVIEPVVAAAGYDLEDVSLSRAGRRHVVRVIVDGDAGVSLDAVAEVSRDVSKALDRAEETGGDLLAGEYQLEVSSPGVDRPLTLPRHWRRNVGRLVRVTVRVPGALPAQRAGAVPEAEAESSGAESSGRDRQITGRVLAADDEWVTIDVAGEPARWSYPDLGPGRVQVEFTRLDDADDADESAEFDDFDDEDVEDEER